jgi:ABC-type glycerol-3-phosphate transport system substrate-binding protein
MRLRVLLMLLVALGLAACGGAATTSTLATAEAAGDLDLSGLSLQVHQAPG